MTKIERLRAALAGKPVDRAPVSIWYHFGNQHAPPERTAEVHLEFFEAYDLDLLKVMNDYDYPMPDGMEVMATADDLKRIAPFEVTRTPLGRQLKAIELIAKSLQGKALFVDTVFNAWNTLRRNLVKEAMGPLMADHPQALEAALQVVTDNLLRYALASLERGAAGIFLSVPATAETVTPEQYARFMRPFDLQLLNALLPVSDGNQIQCQHTFCKGVLRLNVQRPACILNRRLWLASLRRDIGKGCQTSRVFWVHDQLCG